MLESKTIEFKRKYSVLCLSSWRRPTPTLTSLIAYVQRTKSLIVSTNGVCG